jgi:alpha-glucosidase (family GH31 glycosyl hydrolase)
VRHYASLRYSLMPYFQALAYEANASGLPLMRHLKLEFPQEPGVEWIDDQYLLGPDVLIAPILQEGARSRVVYFPAGRWVKLEDPRAVVEGAGYRTVEAPLEDMPVFVRAGALLPRYIHNPQHLKGPAPAEMALDLYAGAGERHLRLNEGGEFSVDYQNDGRQAHLVVSPVAMTLHVRLVGWRAVSGDNALLPTDQLTVDAIDGISLHLVREE